MIGHIRERATLQTEHEIDQAVIGRPVSFHGTQGKAGDLQALQLIREAAHAAGVREVQFLEEPLAAAFALEGQLTDDLTVLVVDVGGGTTDCSVVQIGPSFRDTKDKSNQALSYSGDRVGGRNFDIDLCLTAIMPHFGKLSGHQTTFVFPNHEYAAAAEVDNIPKHAKFLSGALSPSGRLNNKARRLLKLHAEKLTYRLNSSAELAKIALSTKPLIHLPLGYVEENLVIDISRDQFMDAVSQRLQKITALARDAVRSAQVAPDRVLLTGGMAESPIVRDVLAKSFPRSPIVERDHFGDVCSGLTSWAHQVFAR